MVAQAKKRMSDIQIIKQQEIGYAPDGSPVDHSKAAVSVATSFKQGALRLLKGAPLSIFLCVALHEADASPGASLSTLQEETGYSRPSVIAALRFLTDERHRFIEECGVEPDGTQCYRPCAWFGPTTEPPSEADPAGNPMGRGSQETLSPPNPMGQQGSQETLPAPNPMGLGSQETLPPPAATSSKKFFAPEADPSGEDRQKSFSPPVETPLKKFFVHDDDDVCTSYHSLENEKRHHVIAPARKNFSLAGFCGKHLETLAKRGSPEPAGEWSAWVACSQPTHQDRSPPGSAGTVLETDPSARPKSKWLKTQILKRCRFRRRTMARLRAPCQAQSIVR
jgi:hypothetical protein